MLYGKLIKPLLFSLPPEQAHHIVTATLSLLGKVPGGRWLLHKLYATEDPSLEREVFGIRFKNPVGMAAGFDRYGHIYRELSAMGFGFVEVGSITPKRQPGNPKPRIFRLDAARALLNRVGICSHGLDRAVAHLRQPRGEAIVGCNIGKNTATPCDQAPADYLKCFRNLYQYADYFTINVACDPGQKAASYQTRENITKILEPLFEFRRGQNQYRPILLKVSPDLSDETIDLMTDVRDRIAREIYPDPLNNQIQKGGVIADGVDPELDDLRRIALHGKDYLARIQQRESETTGIPSLKISYNNVFGYYIEVRNAHKDKVPQSWIRKQTLANAERYITEELKEYEEKILGAEEKMLVIEQRIYADIIAHISRSLAVLLRDAAVVARVDCLQSFARIACERRYVRPVLDDGKRIDIRQGRHPVIETLMPVGEEYIPNDVLLDDKEQQIMMITGPNMSGKSALLRQTALIILMAQMGSFVPAKSAHIGVVDKIFTRVGASDNISQGESTFMVEMLESASILNNISDRSIVLLDEIGRGTSTYDGISIAWAMVEYLHNHPTAHAKTLFATHYHELNEMEQMCPRVKNYHVSVKEMGNQIVFLRKLERGGTEHSFGIHVARMAGMPVSIVSRADEILRNLELVYGNNEIVPSRSLKERGRKSAAQAVKEAAESAGPQNMQLSMFQLDDPVLVQIRDQIKGLDINSLTPIEALNKLNEIKKITGI